MSEKKLSQDEIKELAKQMVGDGESPNKWFVTVSPYIVYYKPNDTEPYTKLIDDFYKEDTFTYGPYDTYEDALAAYEDHDLDETHGIGQVFIEDRKTGTVKEKWLEEKISVRYLQNEYSDYTIS